jgi:cysteine desulfurase
MIYLDYSATTKVDKRVLSTYEKTCLEYPGNSNSLHSLGVKSKELEDYSTEMINKILKLKDKEVIYTSGSSESNNLAIKGVAFKYNNRGKHIITTYLEHSSIIEPLKYLSNKGFEIDYVKIRDNGLIDIDNLKELLRDDTLLVSISAVDSELGIRQPIKEIGEILKEYPKCYYHVDCTQAVGKIDIDFDNIDLASISAHKIYGLKGVGLLIKNKNLVIEPLIHGGKSTTNYRSGTPALPLIVSMMRALDLIIPNIKTNYDYVSRLNKKIKDKLSTYDKVNINSTINSIPYIINFSIKGIKSETFLHALESYDIYISTKSACSSEGISDAVYAVTKDRDRASNSLRVSLSYLTTEQEIERFLEVFDKCLRSLTLK